MKPTIKIVDLDGSEIEREMNDAEYAQFEADQADLAAKVAAQEEVEAAKKALLLKLGITADEARLLLS